MESRLANCYDLLAVYRRDNKLGPPKVSKPKVGFSSTNLQIQFNESNWVSTHEILEMVRIFDKKDYKKNIEIKELDKLDNEDKVYIITTGNHCAVGLFLSNQNKIFLADGWNIYLKSRRTQMIVQDKMPGTTIEPVTFNQQSSIDHCASSAVAIAIEFKRIYGNVERIPKFRCKNLS